MPMQPEPTDERIPRKRQARLDDNGEPARVPAPKKIKSAEKNGQKKKVPAKAQPEKKKNPSVPLKKPHPSKYRLVTQMLQGEPI
jgi:hypothetical protein